MAQGNHFLSIPKQEGLFATIKSGRAGEARYDSVEDEDEEETEEEVRFIPRCSPVPRKRGPSIADETAEYMRIRLALPQRRVSFADASGGELVDVREFAAFDSGDEEDDASWEEEEAKCRRAYLQPVYRVWPEFEAPAGSDLTLAVRANKVEVQSVTAVQDEPLAFDALICVLNVSYHKCVYVRSTMDGWITHSDSVAEYVEGSHDADTDKFSVRLSFTEPYLFNGARIDFVVRYETSNGEFWANNSGRNYSVTLIMSYEEDSESVNKVDDREIKGILKPPRYRAEDDSDIYPDTDNGSEDNAARMAVDEIPSPVCPLVIEPEIDIEISEALISPSKSGEEPTIAECPLPRAHRQDQYSLQGFLENPPQTVCLEQGQGTELIIPTENIAVSIQNETPDDYSTSNLDSLFVHSVKNNQDFCPHQDNLLSDIAVQAPFDIDMPLPAMLPSIQDIMNNDFEENEEMDMAHPQDPSNDTKEADSTEPSLQELQESTQQCSLNELITASAIKDEGDVSHSTAYNILFKESCEPFLESPEIQMIKDVDIIRQETCGKQQAGLWLGEVPDTSASCMLQPLEPTDVGHNRDNSVTQNVSNTRRTPDQVFSPIQVIECQKQGKGPKPELKEVLEVRSVNVDTPSSLESTAPKDESPTLTSLSSATATSQSLTTTVQAVAPEGGDAEPSMVLEEPLSTNEKSELYFDDPDSFQKQEELKSQHSLPCKTLKASNSEVDVILGKTLIPSFAFLSVTVCLVVGFHEPSIFLIMTLFLVSLCF